ncbi:hypothetical protein GQ53DRAFT_782156 [Thozetella sp. PMI_491]|nr:hypothetical protein GQ53DRAFT_782156 [Thozetella sp. PMI_491]
MTQQLDSIFEGLGIAQYLDVFVDQGFDTWETILDITESDLDALGVKLGHRRKLQRRIANSRGLAPQASLVSPTHSSVEEGRVDGHRPDPTAKDSTPVVITKRKYRRHPKPDENAPERPPSAYVLFSNKMREDLKGRNLTFTEIAKLVGENWQNLSPAEKEPYESQAQAAKETYNIDLANYKKTPECKKYAAYLQEFKAKYSHQAQEKDASKRLRLSEAGGSNQSSSSANATPDRTSRSGSGSDAPGGNEPLPQARQQRINSTVSATTESHYPSVMTPSSHHYSMEDSMASPGTSADRLLERSPTYSSTSPRDMSARPSRRNSGWIDDQQPNLRSLPPLSDVFDSRSLLNGGPPNDVNGFPFSRGPISESPGPVPGLISLDKKPPPLNKEQSSSASTSSGSGSNSSYGFPRTPIEGSLPIHALLGSTKLGPSYEDCTPPLPLVQPMYRSGPSPPELNPVYPPRPQVNGIAQPPMTNGT